MFAMKSENSDGAKRTRTADPLHAMQVLYQLSYGPIIIMCIIVAFIYIENHNINARIHC